MKRSLGDLIIEKRKASGLSQKDLAKKMGIAASTLSKVENGKIKNVSFANAQKLSKIFNVKITAFIPKDASEAACVCENAISEERTSKMSERIRRHRKLAKMTQRDLARALNVSEHTVRKWETKRVKNVPPRMIQKMSGIFNVRPQYLIGIDDDPDSVDRLQQLMVYRPDIKELVLSVEECPVEFVETLSKIAEAMKSNGVFQDYDKK